VADVSVAALLSPATIRERCRAILAAAETGASRHFRIDRARLDTDAQRVDDVTRHRYLDLRIPYHNRWTHFEAGGVDRGAELARALAGHDAAATARARIDLATVSVLLDAGAGAAWHYDEAASGQRFARSEGLGVASFRAFLSGAFSARRDDPLRVDAAALARFDVPVLARIFQVGAANPLVGLDGRAALLRRLSAALQSERGIFGEDARPGALYDTLTADGSGEVGAASLLRALLQGLGSVWRTGNVLHGVPLGDTWRHRNAGGSGPTAGWVPFHKLSQWLAYSLFEPLEWAGVRIAGRDALTALPEYRNGGLLLDSGVLALANPRDADVPHDVGSELVVEWRALTVALLDDLAPRVRARLSDPNLPLACILEGGTWAAGRLLAQELRGGDPPLSIRSDGTVF
jgi:hypothetical protein